MRAYIRDPRYVRDRGGRGGGLCIGIRKGTVRTTYFSYQTSGLLDAASSEHVHGDLLHRLPYSVPECRRQQRRRSFKRIRVFIHSLRRR